jgi:TRAP-type C4-dicarboxylate transport system substrate-binding protein
MESKSSLKACIAVGMGICILSLHFGPTKVAAQEPIKLKLSESYTAKHYLTTHGYEVWAKKVEEATKGRVKVSVFAGGTLAKIGETYDATVAGVCDIGMYVPAYNAGRFPLSDVMNLPMLFPNAKVASLAAWQLYEKFPEMRKEYGDVKLLWFYCTPPYEIHTVKKPISRAADLKGLQVRTVGPMDAKMIEILGATPVALPMPEAYMSLQKGVLDGILSPFGPMRAFKTAEVTKFHTTNASLFSNLFCVVMNLKRWNSLPPDIQEIMDQVSGASASEMFGTAFDSTTQGDIKFMKEKGDTFTTIAPDERKRWVAAFEGIKDKWIKDVKAKGMPGEKIITEVARLSGN